MRAISLDGVPQRRAWDDLTDLAPAIEALNRRVGPGFVERAILGRQGWTSDLDIHDQRSVGAVLRTADGAEKYVVMPWPPKRKYKTCISRGSALVGTVSFATRRYVLVRHEYDGPQQMQRVIYEEQP